MTNSHLKKITIKHLRGSVEPFVLEFEAGKKLTVVYGENGTGKSTICDAFEFLGKGRVGSIEGRGLGRTAPYWASLGKDAGDISVELECSNSSCLAQMSKKNVVVLPAESKPKIEILRRSQILSLIEASPGDRYKVISRFVDVLGIEESEKSLIKLIKYLKGSVEVAIARIDENRDTIHTFYSEAGSPGKDALAWAEQEVLRDFSSLDTELRAINALRDSYSSLSQRLESIQKNTAALDLAKEELGEAQKQFDKVIATVSEGTSELLELLKTAQHFFVNHPHPTACPLCESAENVDGLVFRSSEKIDQLSALNAAIGRKDDAKEKFQQAQQRLRIVEEEVQSGAQRFRDLCLDGSLRDEIPMPMRAVPTQAEDLTLWLEQTKHLPDQWILLESQRQDKKQFFAALRKSIKTYKENIQQQQELETLVPRLEKTLKVIEEERREFTDELLFRIADEVGRLYDIIHPGEGLNKISLQLDSKKRASLDISTEFCGSSGVPPQAYFSESHLDTLGLCVFLALTGLDSPEEIILVLDDVLASIDEPHVERLINLLHDETQRFRHCVITTHYRPWKHKLRWGWLQNGQCHFVELTRWNATKGLTLIRAVPEIQRLQALLQEEPPDLQVVCAKAGVILEATLDFLTQLYECKVPRRPNNLYTLGDLLPAIDKKLRKALKVDVIDGEDTDGEPIYITKHLKEIIDEITRIAQARNVVGAHFNALSFDLLDADALGFAESVVALTEILVDPQNGWPKNSKSGSYWATSGETRRLHPLRKPD